ncbi:MAG: CoA transferase [Acidimicrobiia bacterium]|nr:CoA transferase [Acidimicrobiia bacterium]
MTAVLEGILVVAVEQAVAAPVCTARLRDAGARVIKVERSDGDFARGYDTAAGGDSSYFAWANHGKESVVLDFKHSEDAALLRRMIAAADVFVQNLAPGALERTGFGSNDLRADHPSLITLDISGYGEAPELAEKKAYDLLVQAESGLIGISGGPNELGRVGVSVCDIGTGVTAYGAVLEALLARATTGRGRGIRLSLFDMMAEWMTVPLVQHEHGGGGPTRVGLRHPSIAPYGAYATSEGALTLISIQNEREWVRLCAETLADPDLAIDPRFTSNNDRVANREALEAELSRRVELLDRAEFHRRLGAAAIAYGSVNSLDDLAVHPALRRRTIVSSTGAAVDLAAHPVRWTLDPDATPSTSEPTEVPAVGAHTDAVRAEFS